MFVELLIFICVFFLFIFCIWFLISNCVLCFLFNFFFKFCVFWLVLLRVFWVLLSCFVSCEMWRLLVLLGRMGEMFVSLGFFVGFCFSDVILEDLGWVVFGFFGSGCDGGGVGGLENFVFLLLDWKEIFLLIKFLGVFGVLGLFKFLILFLDSRVLRNWFVLVILVCCCFVFWILVCK